MNENKPFFSVIVPVYNVEKYLHRCVDSILAQSYSDFEVLLVDDGSIDKSGVICDDYALKDNRIRVFHQANAGVSAARNKGIDEAKGEYVVFVDSDDYLKLEKLNNLYVNSVEKPQFITNYKEVYDIYGNQKVENTIDVYKWGSHICIIWNSAFQRLLLKEYNIRFCEELSHGEDSLFILDVLSYVSSIVFYEAWDYVYEEGHEGGLNQKFQPFDKELLTFEKMAQARKRYYLRRGLCVSNTSMNNIGEILRVIKSIYLGAALPSFSDRLSMLHSIADKLKTDNYIVSTCKSDIVISRLFKNRYYFLLDLFVKLWIRI